MNTIGWKQQPTIIQEDNQAYVYASEAKHMTRNLRHLELAQLWFKEKVADGRCIIEKVDSKEINSDIGTKRVPKFIFDYLTHKLVDKSLRTNIYFNKYSRIISSHDIIRRSYSCHIYAVFHVTGSHSHSEH